MPNSSTFIPALPAKPTSDKARILIQLDTDPLPSVFDRVVAIDSGVQHLFSYGGVTPENVMPLVHGCIFTRGSKDLHHTAIFVGGSDVAAGEALVRAIRKHLIPAAKLSVSIMLDSNGANTTAAAAVRAASKHVNLDQTESLVLGGTGPVGQRVARLLAKQGGHVRIGSRQLDRAEAVAARIRKDIPGAKVEAVSVASSSDGPKAMEGRELVVAAGAPGAVLLPKKFRDAGKDLHLMIDLNGVPPTGIEGVELMDAGVDRDGKIAYGALGVGGTKMKIHRAAVAALFERNDATLDIDDIYDIALRVQ
ncbi:methylene-tetrahydromethanopterin dehydrogenase N-terminal domain-containing protein [Limnoglobus roseus]|uniref:Bifunctional NADP-dependent methylenetetrahydromethanopterin dehydrogenase/methylenetetrahydrofolate dehydrogenase n=1 Tax=Limnoglobus roseus TaxID=2598579 RepID=A0A5C1A7T4_9BACT|nr:methylene-tetrahydromethanopterin dehydrogenase N-terminal domain-containing protein [Limnoglobus roseus]QEL13228.1 bifunctional NADP-dependent methylenetetrahydromethanopterin dehydrogenase/methylenetetrahydrofolate dehydrogenase [Limnoglobus roseus]